MESAPRNTFHKMILRVHGFMGLTVKPWPNGRASRWKSVKVLTFSHTYIYKQVIKIVRAIRNGWIKPKKTDTDKPRFYMLWDKDDEQVGKQN